MVTNLPKEVRVRFAPSPTGHLHIGGARTALFNWLFARGRGGEFILRVEDSDRKRSREESATEILEELKWLGLDWDEGPFFQAERNEIYRRRAHDLLSAGKALRDGEAIVCPVEREGEVEFSDLIRDKVSVAASELKDIVLLKSDGSPAYNFACVVDDHEMEISHVIRGEDHIPNTPKQVLLYRALGWEPPVFAHLPLILGEDKTRLSKRHGAVSLQTFRRDGFLATALRNYLALLGWSPGDDREFFSTRELIENFSLDRVNKSGAVFDYDKLTWLNGRHIQKTPPSELADLIEPILEREGWGKIPRDRLEEIIAFLGARLKTLNDFPQQAKYFFFEEITFDPEAVERYWGESGVREMLAETREVLSAVEPFSEEKLEKALRGLAERLGIKAGRLIHPLRVAVTGQAESPGIFKTIELIGKETALKRLDQAVKY